MSRTAHSSGPESFGLRRIHRASKAEDPVLEIRLGRETRRDPEVARRIDPAPSAEDLALSALRPPRILFWALRVIRTVIPVRDPFRSIARDVVESEGAPAAEFADAQP